MSADAGGRTGGPATPVTTAANASMLGTLPFDDGADFDDARRGLIAGPPSERIVNADGREVWPPREYRFDHGWGAPASVNPSLWRQARLNAVAGLFRVTHRIYQIRGLDLANMSIVEADDGIVVVDPLASVECAKVGLDLYRRYRGDRPVLAVIYTHSHFDHYGGVKAAVSEEAVEAGTVPVLAPAGFLAHTVSENVFAGTAMSRRAHYQYGVFLPRTVTGQVDLGLGKAVSTGTITLIPPTELVDEDGIRVVAGVPIEFQLTPGAEAPAGMNLYLPSERALCAAESAGHTLHNLLSLRGAEVRDPRLWARYLDESIERFGARTDVLFGSHHWPTWGRERIETLLADQRDAYQFLHDQTLRLANHGLTPMEIAEALTRLPPQLENRWYLRGYHGSLSLNVRAIYQRYLGCYDGNPAHLDPHPPVEAATRYVTAVGGAQRMLELGRQAYQSGDYRWCVELVNHLVFARPDLTAARELQADALEQLGYQCENGTWRAIYLTGAYELRHGVDRGVNLTTVSRDTLKAMTPELYFAYLGTRIDGDKAAHLPEIRLDFRFTDLERDYAVTLRNAALTCRPDRRHEAPHATVLLTKAVLDAVTVGQSSYDRALAEGAVEVVGDRDKLVTLFHILDDFDLMFNLVTP